jgi:tRNA(Arg) A34 adenosine deaminase TadA
VVGTDLAWERALELAWEAFCGGTTPVGAVVIDAAGDIVAEGRGRRYEPAGPPGQLAGSHVAHAEVNALAQLSADRHYEDHALLTTLEPCGMCHGAAIQASVGSLAYAGADPYAGTGHLDFGIPQTRNRPLRVTGPCPTSAAAWPRSCTSSSSSAAAPAPTSWPPSRPPSPPRPPAPPTPAPSASSPASPPPAPP